MTDSVFSDKRGNVQRLEAKVKVSWIQNLLLTSIVADNETHTAHGDT